MEDEKEQDFLYFLPIPNLFLAAARKIWGKWAGRKKTWPFSINI